VLVVLLVTSLLTRCRHCANPLGRHNAFTARCPQLANRPPMMSTFEPGQEPLSHQVIVTQRLHAPRIDGFTRVTTWLSDLPPYHVSTLHEPLWSTNQGRTPFFRWTPIYDQLCSERRDWPVDISDDEHERYVNQPPFWRYDEYRGRHRAND
jgi:hypothetical protein